MLFFRFLPHLNLIRLTIKLLLLFLYIAGSAIPILSVQHLQRKARQSPHLSMAIEETRTIPLTKNIETKLFIQMRSVQQCSERVVDRSEVAFLLIEYTSALASFHFELCTNPKVDSRLHWNINYVNIVEYLHDEQGQRGICSMS